jgi:uncharacterized membrane protein YhiD involved in acid resistance
MYEPAFAGLTTAASIGVTAAVGSAVGAGLLVLNEATRRGFVTELASVLTELDQVDAVVATSQQPADEQRAPRSDPPAGSARARATSQSDSDLLE